MDTAQLVAGCLAGDEDALTALLAQHQARLYRLALSVLDDSAEAEDAVQEAWITAVQRLELYRGDASLATWLYSITLNICRSRLRQRQARQRLKQVLHWLLGAGDAPPEDEVVRREAKNSLWQALQALDEKHRLPVILRYYDQFSVAEIAAMLGISQGTVSSRLFTARDRLREQLCNEVPDER